MSIKGEILSFSGKLVRADKHPSEEFDSVMSALLRKT